MVPLWDGQCFVVDGERTPVLEYSENFAGWSDDLTALHEEAAGDSHPIDIASRYGAIRQVKEIVTEQGQVIMEIGCSSGFLIQELVENFPDAVVIGADVVKAPLMRLAESLPNVPLIRFDLLQNPLPEACVDVLVMLNVLEHIQNDLLALSQAFKLLKPGGCLVMEVPACRYLYDAYDQQLHHFRRYSARELQTKLESVGFQVDRKSHLGFFIFPAFAIVKLINKMKGNSMAVVQNQASRTSRSRIMAFLTRMELKLSHLLSYPFGIRILVTASKPFCLNN